MAISTTDTPEPDDIHEGRYADLLPDMFGSEFERLKTSMEQHGFDETTPIVVTPDGEIVDGHHRYRAAQAVGVEPAVRVTDDVDPEQAIRTNLARRDHDSGAKREIVADWLLSDRYDDDRSQREVAEELGVTQSTVGRAMKEAFPERYEEDGEDESDPAGSPDGVDRSRVSDTSTDKGGGESSGVGTPDTDVSNSGDDSDRAGESSVSGPGHDVSGPDESNDSDDAEAEAFEDVEQLVGADSDDNTDSGADEDASQDAEATADDTQEPDEGRIETLEERAEARKDAMASLNQDKADLQARIQTLEQQLDSVERVRASINTALLALEGQSPHIDMAQNELEDAQEVLENV